MQSVPGIPVKSDANLVERLHDKLKTVGVKMWWDRRCPPAGQPCEQGYADGLSSWSICVLSTFSIGVTVLSKTALAACTLLTAASACDKVVLEHQIVLELHYRGDLRALYPVFVSELQHHPTLGHMYGDFFFKGCSMPACHWQGGVVVEVVEDKWSILCVLVTAFLCW